MFFKLKRFSDLTFKRALLLAAARVAIPTIALVYRDVTCEEPKKWRPHIDLNVKYGSKRDIGRIGAFGPIVQTNDMLSYVDFRFMADSRSNQEGNFGLGHRWLDAHLERIWGGYVYYDRRKSNLGNTYNQLTLGLECLSLTWDYRANVYLPESKVYTKEIDKKTEKKVSYTFDIEKIQTFEKITLQKEVPLKGIDLEVGRTLPGLPHLRLYTGVYYYQGRAGVNSIKGYSIRARYDVNTYVSFQAEATHDTVRKRNVYIGLELRIPLGKENAKTRRLTPLEERMTLAPVRDVDIVANNHTEVVSVEHTTITKNGIITFDGPGAPRDPLFKKGHAENPYLFTDINHPELKDVINQTHVKHVRIPEGNTLVIIEIDTFKNHVEQSKAEARKRPAPIDVESIFETTRRQRRMSRDVFKNDTTYSAPVEAMRQQALADALASSANRERIENARNHAEHETKRRPLTADEEEILRQQVHEAAVTATAARESCDNALNDVTYNAPVEAMRQQALADALASSANRERIENARNHAEHETKRRPLIADEEKILRQQVYEAAVTGTTVREARDNALNDAAYSVPVEAMRQQALADALASSHNRERIENARNHAEYENKRRPLTVDEEEILRQWAYEAAVTATAAREARDNALNDATYSVPLEAMRQRTLTDALASSANRERIENARNHAEYETKRHPLTADEEEILGQQVFEAAVTATAAREARDNALNDTTYSGSVEAMRQQALADAILSSANRERIENERNHAEYKLKIKKPLKPKTYTTPEKIRNIIEQTLLSQPSLTDSQQKQLKMIQQKRSWDELVSTPSSKSNTEIKRQIKLEHNRNYTPINDRDNQLKILMKNDNPTSKELIQFKLAKQQWDEQCMGFDSAEFHSNPLLEATPSYKKRRDDLIETKHDDGITIAFATGGSRSIMGSQSPIKSVDDYYKNIESSQPSNDGDTHDLNEKFSIVSEQKMLSNLDFNKENGSPNILTLTKQNLKKLEKQVSDYRVIKTLNSPIDLGFDSDRSPDSGSDLSSDRSPDSGSDLSSDRSPDSGSDLSSDRSPDSGSYFGENDEDGL